MKKSQNGPREPKPKFQSQPSDDFEKLLARARMTEAYEWLDTVRRIFPQARILDLKLWASPKTQDLEQPSLF